MRYALNVSIGYFPAQIRAGLATKKVIGSILVLLTRAITIRPDVFIEVERYDAAVTARDNDRNEIAKQLALQVTA